MKTATHHRSPSGFTVVEALIALTLISVVIVALSLSLTGGWRGVAVSETERQALRVARLELTRAGVETPLRAGTTRGRTDDGFAYEVAVRPYAGPAGGERFAAVQRAFWVEVTVSYRDGLRPAPRRIRLATLKLEDPL